MARTEALFLTDAYMRDASAVVVAVLDGGLIVLDRTVCYPQGGGQPGDTGSMTRASDGQRFRIRTTRKEAGDIVHEVDEAGLAAGDALTVAVDWDRRYALMRYHTAAHVLSAIVHAKTGALITGNQISEDKLRIDFSLDAYDPDALAQYVQEANDVMAKGYAVTARTLPREEALTLPGVVKLAGVLPPSLPTLRIVRIGDDDTVIDEQADGGTHVRSTSEVGQLQLVKVDNKGKSNRRLTVRFSSR